MRNQLLFMLCFLLLLLLSRPSHGQRFWHGSYRTPVTYTSPIDFSHGSLVVGGRDYDGAVIVSIGGVNSPSPPRKAGTPVPSVVSHRYYAPPPPPATRVWTNALPSPVFQFSAPNVGACRT